MFDPWTASEDQIMSEQKEWMRSGNSMSSAVSPMAQFIGANKVKVLKEKIDEGNGFAVLAAIHECVTHGLVAPEWLACAFNRCYGAVVSCRALTWDDPQSFGRPYPKGTNLAAQRKARVGKVVVWNAVVDLLSRNPDASIDKGLFEEIGKPLGLGATLTEEYYYQGKQMFGYNPREQLPQPSTAKKRKSAGLRKNRT